MNQNPHPLAEEDEAILAFTPVAMAPRATGWTPRRQRDFIRALAATGTVGRAARAVGLSRQSAYTLRARPDAASFVRAWDNALLIGYDRVFEMAMDRALNGVTTPRYYRGRPVGTVTRPDLRMAMAVLSDPVYPPATATRLPKMTE
ncbi:hypothetical protein ACPVPU_14870 [Sphingomonas sp. CJ99]